MSFSVKVKDDLCRVASTKECCRRAEFIAFFLINGNIRLTGRHQLSVFMQTEHSGAVRKMFTLAREFGLEREISVYRRPRLHKNQVYTLTIPPQRQLTRLLQQLRLIDGEGYWQMGFPPRIREDVLAEECCRRAYLRGAFLASGSLSDPDDAYHLEFNGMEERQAELLVELINDFGLRARSVRRRDTHTVYLKGAEDISRLLIIMGSHRSLLEFESVRVTKEVRNNVNRQRNCDTANINKVVSAGMRQIEDINFVVESIGWETLPHNLREVAELRLENPEFSLADLSEASSLGRSAINHRLRRISKIARNIRDFGPDKWDV